MSSKKALKDIFDILVNFERLSDIHDEQNIKKQKFDIVEKDLETSEILKTIFKSIIKNYDDINQNFILYLNTELYGKLKELLNDK